MIILNDRKYCMFCGTKQVPIENGCYDPDTGEKQIKMTCPNRLCKHNCEHKYGLFGFGSKCIICGFGNQGW